MLVDAITDRDVATVGRDHTILRVARLMREKDAGAVVVVDEKRRPIGMLTDRDIAIRVVADGKDAETPVDVVMTHPVFAVSENSLIFDALRAMAKHHVHRAPVIDANQALVGLINVADALTLLTTEQVNVAVVLSSRKASWRT
jgi:CBS domain-containing protein